MAYGPELFLLGVGVVFNLLKDVTSKPQAKTYLYGEALNHYILNQDI